ncbi:hypothetical protein NEOKW01_0183 [Nematocida sp. AWRm80]|nr:hypothetical protein NEOKW01_0183 [Nematocida sp. AWRm80]
MKMNRNELEQNKQGKIATAQVIFGDKTVFISFTPESSLSEILALSIIELASSFHPQYQSVPLNEIDLKDYEEFAFYLEDNQNRKISLAGKETQIRSILGFFDYKLIIHIYLIGLN